MNISTKVKAIAAITLATATTFTVIKTAGSQTQSQSHQSSTSRIQSEMSEEEGNKESKSVIDDVIADAMNPKSTPAVPTTPEELTYLGSEETTSPRVDKSLPLKSLVYGSMKDAGSANIEYNRAIRNFTPELVIQTFDTTSTKIVKYRFLSPRPENRNYIFNPVLLPNNRDIVFLFGRSDYDTDGPSGLYVFNVATKKIRKVADQYVARDFYPSPNGRYVGYIGLGSSITLKINDLQTGKNTLVAEGDSILIPSWLSNDELLYSLNKRHKIGDKAVLLPTNFAFNVVTGAYRVFIDVATTVNLSPDRKYAVYGSLRKPSLGVSQTNYAARFKSFPSGESKELPRIEKNLFVDVFQSHWDGSLSKLFWVMSDLDEASTKRAEGHAKKSKFPKKPMPERPTEHRYYALDKGAVGTATKGPAILINEDDFRITKHKLYAFDAKTQSIGVAGNLDTQSYTEGADLNILCFSPDGQTIYFSTKEAGHNISAYTGLPERRYTIKSYNLQTRQWKDLVVLEGVMGFSGLMQDSSRTNLISY